MARVPGRSNDGPDQISPLLNVETLRTQPVPIWNGLALLASALLIALIALGPFSRERRQEITWGQDLDIRAMSVAISRTEYGLGGGLYYRQVESTLLEHMAGGPTAASVSTEESHRRAQDPVYMNEGLRAATSLAGSTLPHGSVEDGTHGYFSEDTGTADLYALAFRLFGYDFSAIPRFYVAFLAVSAGLFALSFWTKGAALAALVLILSALYGLTTSPIFYELMPSISAHRGLSTLALIPFAHIICAIRAPERLSPWQLVLVLMQASLLVFVTTFRSSAMWTLIGIGLVAAASFRYGPAFPLRVRPGLTHLRQLLVVPVVAGVRRPGHAMRRGLIHLRQLLVALGAVVWRAWHAARPGLMDLCQPLVVLVAVAWVAWYAVRLGLIHLRQPLVPLVAVARRAWRAVRPGLVRLRQPLVALVAVVWGAWRAVRPGLMHLRQPLLVLVVVAGVWGAWRAVERLTLDPVYFSDWATGGRHMVWHSAYIALPLHPEWPKVKPYPTQQDSIGDSVTAVVFDHVARADCGCGPGGPENKYYAHGDVKWGVWERVARDAYIGFAWSHPGYMLELFVIHKPLTYLKDVVLQSLPHIHSAVWLMLLGAAALVALLARSAPGGGSQTAAVVLPALFGAHLPVFWAYGVIYSSADAVWSVLLVGLYCVSQVLLLVIGRVRALGLSRGN